MVFVKKSDCMVAGGNTWEKEYVEVCGAVESRYRDGLADGPAGSNIRTDESDSCSRYGLSEGVSWPIWGRIRRNAYEAKCSDTMYNLIWRTLTFMGSTS